MSACMERYCWTLAYRLLLGPLSPDVSVCVHGHRFVLSEMVPPWPAEVSDAPAGLVRQPLPEETA